MVVGVCLLMLLLLGRAHVALKTGRAEGEKGREKSVGINILRIYARYVRVGILEQMFHARIYFCVCFFNVHIKNLFLKLL